MPRVVEAQDGTLLVGTGKRVQGSGFRVRVWGKGCGVKGTRFRVQGEGVKV